MYCAILPSPSDNEAIRDPANTSSSPLDALAPTDSTPALPTRWRGCRTPPLEPDLGGDRPGQRPRAVR